MKHAWLLDENGEVDGSAHDVEDESGGHSGPRCGVCGFFFCQFCHREWWDSDCPGVKVPLAWKPGDPIQAGGSG